MDTIQAASAKAPGVASSAPLGQPQLQSISRSSAHAGSAMPAPAARMMPLTASAPTASKRPWPYGWSASGGISAIRTAQSVTQSLTMSDIECPASATSAEDLPRMPPANFNNARHMLTTAAITVMRCAPVARTRVLAGGRCLALRTWICTQRLRNPLSSEPLAALGCARLVAGAATQRGPARGSRPRNAADGLPGTNVSVAQLPKTAAQNN
mmetsp:Transcript_81378/g.226641  ORF Transcript_81378/g.226641 Transcript_81378/m.226641 type:complete len:211 (-) Transcript_81378:213-845(-)